MHDTSDFSLCLVEGIQLPTNLQNSDISICIFVDLINNLESENKLGAGLEEEREQWRAVQPKRADLVYVWLG